jgi:hypothetical protein
VTAGRFPSQEQLAADASWWAKHQYMAAATLAQAFTVTQVTSPDQPVPYWLDATAMAVPRPRRARS